MHLSLLVGNGDGNGRVCWGRQVDGMHLADLRVQPRPDGVVLEHRVCGLHRDALCLWEQVVPVHINKASEGLPLGPPSVL